MNQRGSSSGAKGIKTMSKPARESEHETARRLLGDVVSDALDRVGLADLIRSHWPNCNCFKRKAQLNALHKRLTGHIIREKKS